MTDDVHGKGSWELRWARYLYRQIAGIYNTIRPLWSSRSAEAQLDALFAERIGKDARVLELAPGTGINIARLFRCSPEFASYRGIDISQAMLDRAKPMSREDERITLEIGDATDLPDEPDSADFIVCTWLLSHLDQPDRVIADSLERLAPGGSAAFLFFTRPKSWLRRTIVGLFVQSFRGNFVELEPISKLPALEGLHSHGGGYATVAVFRRPLDAA